MKTVIVGGAAAGASTGARLRRLDESAEIVVLERDHYVSFANCGLPYHIGGAIPDRDSLLLQTPQSLGRALALDVRIGQDVIRIDRDAREVEVRDLAHERTYRESYDKLVLCTGAEPVRPPILGADDPQVNVLRNIPDMDRIITQLDKDATSAVIVGGSYIGLELTEAFRARGLATTVVERTERLMPWLDPEMTRILDYHVRAGCRDGGHGRVLAAAAQRGPRGAGPCPMRLLSAFRTVCAIRLPKRRLWPCGAPERRR
jgi:NADPH-dependent 2,4-dienoyl-CoA reductase/sulfur reductase-like enzyme